MPRWVDADALEERLRREGKLMRREALETANRQFVALHYPEHVFVREVLDGREIGVESTPQIRRTLRGKLERAGHGKGVHFLKHPLI